MTSTTGKEKRRHVRWPIDLKYVLIIEGQEFSGKLGNISLSGAFLETMTPVPTEPLVPKQGLLKIKGNDDWVSVKCNIIYSKAHNPVFPEGAGSTLPPSVLNQT